MNSTEESSVEELNRLQRHVKDRKILHIFLCLREFHLILFRIVSWCWVTLIWLVASATVAQAQATGAAPTSVDETSPRPSIAKPANGASEVNALINSCKDLKSYKFYSLMTVAKGKKLVENAGTFFFKAPGLMRVEVDGHGPKAGSKLVRNAQGKIRVKGGPALLGITMNIEPDSRLLTLPNGRLLTQCDFLSLVQGLAKEIATGEKATVSSAPLNLTQEPGTKAIVLETQEPGQDANLINQRILIDPKMNVPIRWFGFKNGQLIYSVKFDDLKINPDIADDMFNL